MKQSVIYAIRYQNRIKIGFTRDLKARLGAFRCTLIDGIEVLAVMPGGRSREKSIHAQLEPFHIRQEWFRDTPDVRAILAAEAGRTDISPDAPKIAPLHEFLRVALKGKGNKAAKYVALTGVSYRTAKERLRGAGRHAGYIEICHILRSEHGLEFIKHALGDERPEWFAAIERAKNISETRKAHAALSRRIAQLEMNMEEGL